MNLKTVLYVILAVALWPLTIAILLLYASVFISMVWTGGDTGHGKSKEYRGGDSEA
jgi:hypothetical protein